MPIETPTRSDREMSHEIDHLFMFVRNRQTAASMMTSAGLRVNYSRAHTGQGTTNLCACLDDVFLELLWLDGTMVSRESERASLGARGRGSGCPIGVAWRGNVDMATVSYKAPFLPAGAEILVAAASLAPAMPFVFGSLEAVRPIDRTDGLAGCRQLPDLRTLGHCRIYVPQPGPVERLLDRFSRISVHSGAWRVELDLCDGKGRIARTVRWAGNL